MRDFVLFAAFFVKPDPPPLALQVVVFDVHMEGGGNTGEGVDQQRDQRPVA